MQREAREIARASGEALASPFVCGSRVNSLDSLKWRVCSQYMRDV